jgi:hypothetical protein
MTAEALIPAAHRAERQLLLELISGGVPRARFGRDADERAFVDVTPEPLYPIVSWSLRAHGETIGASQKLVQGMAVHYRGNLMLQMKRRALLRIILETLDAAAIPHLVLKGPVLAATAYPDPATRTMADLDFFVPSADLERASAALEARGLRVPPRFYGSPLEPGDAPSLEHPEYPEVIVELHSLLDSTSDDADAIRSVWSRARRVEIGGQLVPAPGAGDFFAQVVMHCALHHRFENSLRSVLDVALLLKHCAHEVDWPQMREEWKRSHILQWISLTVHLCHQLFGAPLPPGFEEDDVPEEALRIAAAQIWTTNAQRVPPRILYTMAGELPASGHPHVAGSTVPRPGGVTGAAARAYRVWLRLRRGTAAIANGALDPRNVKEALRLFRERERLLDLMQDRHPQEHETR